MKALVDLPDLPWSQIPRVLAITSETPDICTIWRTWWPAMEITRRGYVYDYCTYADLRVFEPALRAGRYNTIVTSRMAFADEVSENNWLAFIDTVRPHINWFYDCDDDLWSEGIVDRLLHTHHWPDPEQARSGLERDRRSRVRLAQEADGVTVASEALLPLARQLFTGLVTHVPNGIYAALYDTPHSLTSNGPLTVGWSGGPRLSSDLEPLYEVWVKLAELRPDVQFILQGWVPPKMATILPVDRLHCSGGLPSEHYPVFLRNINIFCCAASSDPWLACKTPIKWFEATLAGSTCVASNVLYGPTISQYTPKPALIANDADEWLRFLVELIDNQELRQQLHAESRSVVLSNHTISQTWSDWLRAWAMALTL